MEVFNVPDAESLVALFRTNAKQRDLFTLGVPEGLRAGGSLGITTVTAGAFGCLARNQKIMHHSGNEGWCLIDIDAKDARPEIAGRLATAELVLQAVGEIIPDLQRYEYVLFPSSSNGLLYPDGSPVKRSGWHLFIKVSRQSDIPLILTTLLARAFIAGLGWCMVTKSGELRPRGLVDLALIPTNQPIFPGSVAECAPPLSFNKPKPIINKGVSLPTPTINEVGRGAAHRLFVDMANSEEIVAQSDAAATAHKQTRRQKLADDGYNLQQINAMMTSQSLEELEDDDVLYFNDGSKITVGEVLDSNDAKYNGMYMRDPFEPEYGTSRAVLRTRPRQDHPHEKPVILSFAHGGSSCFASTSFEASKIYRFARHKIKSEGVPLNVLLSCIANKKSPDLEAAEYLMANKFKAFVSDVENTPPHILVNGVKIPALRTRAAIYTATGLGKTRFVKRGAIMGHRSGCIARL